MAKRIKRWLSLLVLAALSLNLAACASSAQAADLMTGISSQPVAGKAADTRFTGSVADFSFSLFQKAAADSNSMISPLSVLLALAMTANGAGGQTLAEMETLLGKDIPLTELNEYLYTLVKNLPNEKKAKLSIANSIWFREGFAVTPEFLQTNADYYQAGSYKSAFDSQTVEDINNWVKENTDGMIPRILERIDDNQVMFLINAVAFVAEWEEVYERASVRDGVFTSQKGEKQNTDFMHSTEGLYLEDQQTTGFIKPYVNGYSFVALLPKEGTAISDYIDGLSGERFLGIVQQARRTSVRAALPKFSYDFDILLNDALSELGMRRAFGSEAEFGRLGSYPAGEISIGTVFHKTFIEVDEKGTKAAAATSIGLECTSVPLDEKEVILDRPFVYAIIDNDTNLPLFIGALMEIPQ